MSSIPTSRRPLATRTRTGSSISSRSDAVTGATRSTRSTATTATKRSNTDGGEPSSSAAGTSKPSLSQPSSSAPFGGVGRAKRSAIALSEVTNNKKRAAAALAAEGKGKEASKDGSKVPSRSQPVAGSSAAVRSRAAASSTIAAGRRVRPTKQEEEDVDLKPVVRRTATTLRSHAPTTSRRALADRNTRSAITDQDADPSAFRESKRVKIERDVKPAKDEGWEDLDAEDGDDPLMVAEYVVDIFEYMKQLEIDTMPNPDYMTLQNAEINWHLRNVMMDWLIDTHQKFRLLPETLFLTINIVDRFLSRRMVSLSKLQLIGVTAMFVAAKYEEVLCPSVQNFLYISDGGYTDEEILNAEAYLLSVLEYNLSYPNPMNFLRRISKADSYDIQTRTVAKFLMEIAVVDYRLMEFPPSKIAGAAVWMARLALERGEWTPTLVHYSSYSEEELLPVAELMLDYCLRPVKDLCFQKKYSGKKFLKASTYVRSWAEERYYDIAKQNEAIEDRIEGGEFSVLRVDLFEELGYARPAPAHSEFWSDTPLPDCSIFAREDGYMEGEGSEDDAEEIMSDEDLY